MDLIYQEGLKKSVGVSSTCVSTVVLRFYKVCDEMPQVFLPCSAGLEYFEILAYMARVKDLQTYIGTGGKGRSGSFFWC